METKQCIICKKVKPVSEFYSNKKRGKRIYHNPCKNCNINLYRRYRTKCRKKRKEKLDGWEKTLIYIKARCNSKAINTYKYYKVRNIKCLITKKELKWLWFRDKAYKMKKPSIHRLNSYKDYTYENCCYIEFGKHGQLHRKIN